MLHGRGLIEVVESIPPQPWDGDVWRHVFAGNDPIRANTTGARWNASGTAALYTSLERDTALAEGEHLLAIQSVRPTIARTLHRIEVSLSRMLVLDEEARAMIGLAEGTLSADTCLDCQELGSAISWLNLDGLQVPSVRRVGGTNIAIYVDNQDPNSGLKVAATEQIPS